MGEQVASSSRIAESMRRPIQDYSDLIKQHAGNRAQSLTLFGAIISDSFDPSRHTARSVLVLDAVDLALLRKIALQGAKLGKARISAPLVMTPKYIKSSLDTFPVELIEISQHHLTLFGEDCFADLSFDNSHIRLQCERELKTILIGLRQGLLAAAGREKFISAVETDIGEALMRTLRGMLWLKGIKEAKPAAEVLSEVEKIADRKLSGVRNALDTSAHHGWEEFERLYRDVEALGEIANGW